MAGNILVTYASRYGATAGIAEKIGQTLTQSGLSAEVLPVERVTEVTDYRAVVLGSGVYIGSWLKAAAKFLKANEKVLAEKPVWLFSSGPTGEGDPAELMEGWTFPKSLQPIADRIKPRGCVILHGAIDPEKLSGLNRWIVAKVKSGIGDFRDWQSIEAWAVGIAKDLG